MKKVIIALAILLALGLAVVAGVAFKTMGIYNKIIAAEEAVKAQWAQVQNVYQRRADLVPNLAATVEGYAQHESATLAEVAQARAQMGGVIKPDASLLRDPVAMEKFQASQATFMGGLQRLMMVSERYPDLKANEQFNNMMVQLEGTENRISVERGRYNEAVQMFNTLIRQFPMSLVANFMHVQPFVPFAAKDTAQDAPVVKFNTGAPAVKPGEDPNPDRIH